MSAEDSDYGIDEMIEFLETFDPSEPSSPVAEEA